MKNRYQYTGLLLMLMIISCNTKDAYHKKEEKHKATIFSGEKAKLFYLEHINQSITFLDSLENQIPNSKEAKHIFNLVRQEFKQAEPFAGVLNPETTHRSNGPALPIYKEDSGNVIRPVGLQKLEETIYKDVVDYDSFYKEIRIQKGFFNNLRNQIKKRAVTPQRLFVGIHQQLIRIITLATVGFDTPESGMSIKESIVSLKSLQKVYEMTIKSIVAQKNKSIHQKFIQEIEAAIHFIDKDTDFESFDRYTFIKDYMNPITRTWLAIRKTADVWNPKSGNFPFNFDAPTFFEANSFDVNFFLDVNDRNPSKDKIALGEKLFFDKNLSASGTMSCATCHNPKKAYSDGLKLGLDNSGEKLSRNSPTLINAIYQKAFFWDGRARTIENQINSVFTNHKEFNTKIHEFSGDILQDSSYVSMFKKSYGVVPKKNKEVIRALSVYVSTLKGFNSKFDKNIRGEENTFSISEKKGFNLFMGKALCATCHFLPLTNGTVPPFYTETEKEIIGVSKTAKNKQVDDDRGFYWVHEEEIHDKMFKTPTLRNIALTAPYMHNGVYNTLEEVMDFYNKGGGAGLGFDLPHQTLPFDRLDLSEQEIQDIIAFMNTLTDSY